MKHVINNLKLICLALVLGICFTTISVNAQSPADDPGIGGPGSPGNGPGGDGGPIVPFDSNMSLMLAVSGIAYATLKLKKASLLFN